MAILLLFNKFSSWTVEQMQDKTQIKIDLFLQVLYSLLKSKLITCSEINHNQLDENFNESYIKMNYTIYINENFPNSVWIGILIEFEADERILRAEYINPVNGFDVIQDTLQKQLSKVYSFAVLRSRNILTHHDHRGSATLTVKNLLQAVKDEQYPDFINPTPLQSHNSSRYENTTRTYSTKKPH
ncbi:unnamed protein product [Rotaria sp. Silwood2]|nr:unnamed protein product [Rotaria sp. Silwood2]